MSNHFKQKPFQWHALTTEANVAEIHRQLYQGVRPGTLARSVQGTEPPLFPGHTTDQVGHWFRRYHRNTIQPEWSRSVLGAAHSSRRAKLVQRLEVIADLEDLAVKLRARFDRFFAEECGRAIRPGDASPSNIGKGVPSPGPLPGLDLVARNYRVTLVDLARLYLETGLMYRVPTKIEAALTTAMDGRPAFEFTQEEVDRFDRASLIEGMTREVIEQAKREDTSGDDPGGHDA